MQKQEKNSGTVKNRPIMKWRAGNFEIAVWENKRDFNGGEVSFKTMTMTKCDFVSSRDMGGGSCATRDNEPAHAG